MPDDGSDQREITENAAPDLIRAFSDRTRERYTCVFHLAARRRGFIGVVVVAGPWQRGRYVHQNTLSEIPHQPSCREVLASLARRTVRPQPRLTI